MNINKIKEEREFWMKEGRRKGGENGEEKDSFYQCFTSPKYNYIHNSIEFRLS
jgi:hypothetical protein